MEENHADPNNMSTREPTPAMPDIPNDVVIRFVEVKEVNQGVLLRNGIQDQTVDGGLMDVPRRQRRNRSAIDDVGR